MKCCNSDDLSHLAGTRCVAPLNQHGWGKCFVRGFPLWRDLAVLDMNLHCFWSLLLIPAYYFYDQRSLLLCETAFQCIFFVMLRNYGCYRSWKHLTSIVKEGGKPLNKWRCFDERRRCLTFCRTILLTGLWRSDGDKILLCTAATQFLNWDLANLI